MRSKVCILGIDGIDYSHSLQFQCFEPRSKGKRSRVQTNGQEDAMFSGYIRLRLLPNYWAPSR